MKALLLLFLLLAPDELSELKEKFESEKSKLYAQRISTIQKIGRLKTDAAIDFLERIHNTDRNPSVRRYALTCMATSRHPRALQKLYDLAADPRADYTSRSSALNALASTKSKKAFDLIVTVTRDRSPANRLRMSAYSSLQRFPLKQTESIWREALGDSNISIRGQAFRALAPLKDPEVLREARDVLLDPKATSSIKTSAVLPWKAVGGPEAVRVLLEATATGDSRLKADLLVYFSSLTKSEEIDEIVTARSHRNAGVRAMVARALGKLDVEDAIKYLRKMLRDGSEVVRVAAVEALGERNEPECEELLHKEAEGRNVENALTAINGLSKFKSKKTFKLLEKLTRSRNPDIRISAFDAMGDLMDPEALPLYKKGLKKKEWQIRAAIIRALGKLREKESIDILIERMPKEKGRLQVDIAQALQKLTGKALGYEQKLWKSWWKAKKDSFVFTDKVEGVGGAGGGGAAATTYYGVPVLSERIIFCLDISGSMSSSAGGGESRLELAKKELGNVIKALGKKVYINLIFFETTIDPWQKKLVSLSRYRPQALKAVKALKTRGGTNIYDTLEMAFEDKDVDTIYLLSDGAPGSGKIVDTTEILREIRKKNRSRQIIINTISLGSSSFMRDLAEQNGGNYVEKK